MSWVGASLGSCTQSVPPICFKKYWRSGFLLNPANWDTLFRRTRPPWRRGRWPSPPQRPLRPPACRRHAWRTKMVRPPLASTSLRACQGRPRMTRTTEGKSSRHAPQFPRTQVQLFQLIEQSVVRPAGSGGSLDHLVQPRALLQEDIKTRQPTRTPTLQFLTPKGISPVSRRADRAHDFVEPQAALSAHIKPRRLIPLSGIRIVAPNFS